MEGVCTCVLISDGLLPIPDVAAGDARNRDPRGVKSCIDSTTRSPTFTGLIMMELSPSDSLFTGKLAVSRVTGPDTMPNVGVTALTVGLSEVAPNVAGAPITAEHGHRCEQGHTQTSHSDGHRDLPGAVLALGARPTALTPGGSGRAEPTGQSAPPLTISVEHCLVLTISLPAGSRSISVAWGVASSLVNRQTS